MNDEYRKYSEICSTTDFGDKKSVQNHNEALTQMYEIVRTISEKGAAEIEELATLLDENSSARWLAHHLIEIADIPQNIADECFKIVESYANGNGAEAMGERMWLDEWKKKKGSV